MKFIGLLLIVLISAEYVLAEDPLEYDYEEYDTAVEENVAEETTPEIPPQFSVSPKTFTPIEGETVEIPCSTSEDNGNVLIIYRVKKGSETLLMVDQAFYGSNDKRYSINDKIFTITDVKRTDSDQYNCVYQYSGTKRVNVTHTLDVYFEPNIRRKQRTIKVTAGESAKLECRSTGNPAPRITWSKQDSVMPSGEQQEVGNSITFEDVNRNIAGDYVCNVDNGVGQSVTGSRSIEVSYAPEIQTENDIVHTGSGDRVELVCIVHAFPAATVEWYHNGSPVDSDSRAEVVNGGHRHLLTIESVTETDYGTYSCKANNALGHSENTIQLTDAPSAPSITSDRYSSAEDSYTLTWTTHSFYPISNFRLRYRKSKVNDSTEESAEWMEVSKDTEDTQDNLERSFQHTLVDLDRATDYLGELSVTNAYKQGDATSFSFSTRKETEEQLTSGATAVVSASLFLTGVLLFLQ